METKRTIKFWNKYFICTLLTGLFMYLLHFILTNSMSIYAGTLKGNATSGGILQSAFALGGMLSRFVAGHFADKYGRKKVMLVFGALFAVSTFFIGLFQTFALTVVFRFLTGVAFAGDMTGISASLADTVPKERMSESTGWFWLLMAVGTGVGGTIAMNLLKLENFTLMFAIAALFPVIGLAFTSRVKYETDPDFPKEERVRTEEYRGIKRFIEKKAIPSFCVEFIMSVGIAGIIIFLFLFADYRGFVKPSFFLTLQAAGFFCGSMFSGKLMTKLNPVAMMVCGYLCGALAMFTLTMTHNQTVFYLCGFFFGLGQGVPRPICSMMAIKSVPQKRRGAATSTHLLATDAGAMVGSILWGALIDSVGYEVAFACGGGCFVLSALFSLVVFGLREKREKAQN